MAFLDHLEKHQGVSARSRNLRLTAIRSFFRFAAFEVPTYSAQIQRVLAIPSKRFTRTLVPFLTRAEVDALLAAPDLGTWSGRRDHNFILLAVQTGLRLSEITGLKREDIILGTGAHVRVIGKGRKERCTPIARSTLKVLKGWLREPQRGDGHVLFPNFKGERLSVHVDLPPGVRQTVKTQVAVRWKSIVRRVALTSILRSWTTAVCLLPRRPFAASWQRCLTSCI
jgi:integrase